MMKKTICLLLAVAQLLLLMGCSIFSRKVYTHEEMTAMPADELLKLFKRNGLKINDELKEVFTEEEFQDMFKLEFEGLCQGCIGRSHSMYRDLEDQTKEIYDKLTRSD